MDDWERALDSGSEVNACLINMARAFDRVDHAILSHSLSIVGVSGLELHWFQSVSHLLHAFYPVSPKDQSYAAQEERKPKWRPFSMKTAESSDGFSRAIEMSKNVDIDRCPLTCESFKLFNC